jgi:hypothetical protein
MRVPANRLLSFIDEVESVAEYEIEGEENTT